MNCVTVAYATRFGSTAKLAVQLAAGVQDAGATVEVTDVSANRLVRPQPLIILTPIIWDRPIPAMRRWIVINAKTIGEYVVACGVVCGSAGVREAGGLVYARQLSKRIHRPDVFQFALSGEIPARPKLHSWEWWALRVFASIMRKPQLFAIRSDYAKAKAVGRTIGERLLNQVQ